ncbi:MAG TPA: tetratricopeptide repeat protein, partial [Thermoanaerobaculia bacterium]|nr:tetratricopeptide repeat protein [Thermoanaerobaculia bacterium]
MGRLQRFPAAVLAVAADTGDPLGPLVAAQLRETSDLALLEAVPQALDRPRLSRSVPLREAALLATERVLEHLSTQPGLQRRADRARRARLWQLLVARLGDVGREEEALTASRRAVALYRRLARSAPPRYEVQLAESLNNLALHLRSKGLIKASLRALREALAIFRAQQHPSPGLPTSELVAVLNNLVSSLRQLDLVDESEAAVRELAELFDSLPRDSNADSAWSRLVLTWDNLGASWSALQDHRSGLELAERAVDLHRELAHEQGDVYLPELARSLDHLGQRLAQTGSLEQAVLATEEAICIRRTLATARPAAFSGDLAASLQNLGYQLLELGAFQESAEASAEAIRLLESLFAADPNRWQRQLARALTNHSSQLGHRDLHAEALGAA